MSGVIGLLSHLPELLQGLIAVLGALFALLSALLVVAKIIPGEQPDKFIEGLANKISDLIKKAK